MFADISTYRVSKGDTLGKIAARYNTTVAAIAKENNIADVNKIEVGQVLTIGGAVKTDSVPSMSFSLPKVSVPDLSNNMVNYVLGIGIVALGIPLFIRFMRSNNARTS